MVLYFFAKLRVLFVIEFELPYSKYTEGVREMLREDEVSVEVTEVEMLICSLKMASSRLFRNLFFFCLIWLSSTIAF